jgi:hypothetical protein
MSAPSLLIAPYFPYSRARLSAIVLALERRVRTAGTENKGAALLLHLPWGTGKSF